MVNFRGEPIHRKHNILTAVRSNTYLAFSWEFLPDYRTLTVIVSSCKDARMQKRILGVFRSAVQLN